MQRKSGECGCMDIHNMIAKSNGEKFLTHVDGVLSVFKSIREAYPDLPAIVGVQDFFEHLFFALFFHDVGKLGISFQENMNQYGYRHEIISTSVMGTLKIDEAYLRTILLAVITHHRNIEELKNYSSTTEDGAALFNTKIEEFKSTYPIFQQYASMLPSYAEKYLGYSIDSYQVPDQDELVDGYQFTIRYLSNQRPSRQPSSNIHYSKYALLLKGFVNVCDHLASAGEERILTGIRRMKDIYPFPSYTKIQEAAMGTRGDACVIAPTGYGKTETALFWTEANQNFLRGRRVFYILPYTASINAMYKRLNKDFSKQEKNLVAMKHGKVTYFLYNDLEGEYEEKKQKVNQAKSLFQKMYSPYKVITPFQIIKAFFGVKGYEANLAEMTQGLYILDEIHAYDPKNTALLLGSLQFIKAHLEGNFLIMSATLPLFIKKIFKEGLDIQKNDITVSEDELRTIKRHQVQVLEGDIFEHIEEIEQDLLDNKKVLIVCNTVEKAQQVFNQFKDVLPKEERALLHSRFIMKHRSQIEEKLESMKLLVGTQAIEVSLNIDYDVLYTEPAPLDALIQRFGRVNRKGEKGIVPVKIFEKGSDQDKFIYKKELVTETLEKLRAVDVLDEHTIQKLVNQVYKNGFDEKQQKEFDSKLAEFKALDVLPYQKGEEEQFYRLFDSIEIVPTQYELEYKNAIKEKRYLDAMGYATTIRYRKYCILLKDNMVEKDRYMSFVNCKYDEELGLLLKEKNSNFDWED